MTVRKVKAVKKLLLIVNPYAGMRRVNRYLTEIIDVFNRAGYQVQVHITNGRGDAAEQARICAPEVDLVACAGGDGTFNETVTGLLRSGADVPIGYIPCGSTNDFATGLRLSNNVITAARDIVEGSPVALDIGKFGQRYFSYVASFGAFTKASFSTPQNIKNALGHTAYILEGIQELSQIRTEHIRVETQTGVIEDDVLFGAVSNATSLGGILTLDPKQVDLSDGKFELILVRAPKDLLELHEGVHALQRQQYNCKMITFMNASKLRITANPQMTWTLDGEREDGHAEVTVENLHHAIRIMKRG